MISLFKDIKKMINSQFFVEDLIWTIPIGMYDIGILLDRKGDLHIALLKKIFSFHGDSEGSYLKDVVMSGKQRTLVRIHAEYGFSMTGGKDYRLNGATTRGIMFKLEKVGDALHYMVYSDMVSLGQKKYLMKGLFLNPIEIKLIDLKRQNRRTELRNQKNKGDPLWKLKLKQQSIGSQ